jgi:hypothetical protein
VLLEKGRTNGILTIHPGAHGQEEGKKQIEINHTQEGSSYRHQPAEQAGGKQKQGRNRSTVGNAGGAE